MTTSADAFKDIPGTTLFDGEQLRRGYQLNKFLSSLLEAENRKAFKADQAGYLATFPMTQQQREAVLARDWSRMLDLGGNIFCMTKLAVVDGTPFQRVNAIMSGMSDKEYVDMMNAGGRPMGDIRSKKDSKIG
ncbi:MULTISPECIES: protocatechuate 4,5-dioxygenase subunit alpha [unclassified Beijerinckia]|uniref:protocatechuate 4,5-dioxygenase subunit alpha n=1 Tax=unclassified Beijerinckia TaxID=2638183 RepID=UPI000895D1FE|nr:MULTISPECIES: protocatechuate 4,5-dioxygenase subunit alpha [unclassified Beijerinckia]MDH7797233.1 protocatechuate 4,5-dioxygenase alpha chain [Beijerinckia sp. GAS462]SEC77316.1 protocatechuate 4,5-dioxygenase, alpha chain [Beijerinckia sp. 28-YEA-48]